MSSTSAASSSSNSVTSWHSLCSTGLPTTVIGRAVPRSRWPRSRSSQSSVSTTNPSSSTPTCCVRLLLRHVRRTPSCKPYPCCAVARQRYGPDSRTGPTAQQTSSRSRHSRVSGLSATQPSSSPRTSPPGAAIPHSRSGDPQLARRVRCPSGPGWPGSLWSCGSRCSPVALVAGHPALRAGTAQQPHRGGPVLGGEPGVGGQPLQRVPVGLGGRLQQHHPGRHGRGRPQLDLVEDGVGRARRRWSARRAARRRAGRPRPSGARRTAAGCDCTSIRAGSSRRPQTTSASPSGESRTAALPSSMPSGSPWPRHCAGPPGTLSPYACQARRASGQSCRAVAAMPDVPPVGGAGLPVQQCDGAQPGGPRLLPVVPELVQQRQVEPGLRQPRLQVGGAGQQRARVLVPAVADERERAVGGLPPRGGGPVPYLAEDPHDSRLPVPPVISAVSARPAADTLFLASNHARSDGPAHYPSGLPRPATGAAQYPASPARTLRQRLHDRRLVVAHRCPAAAAPARAASRPPCRRFPPPGPRTR